MKLRSKLFILYTLFVVLYSVLLIAVPPARVTLDQYHLTAMQLRVLDLTIIVPLATIWFAAFYGYAKLRAYTNLIKHTKDGRQVAKITKGLMILTFGLPITTIINGALSRIALAQPEFLPTSVITRQYLSLIIPFTAFILISYGARGLSELAKQRPSQRAVNILVASFTLVGVIYCYLVINAANFASTYQLPIWLVLGTLVVPYLYTWFLGLLAAYEVHLYSQKVDGVVYRKNWDLLAFGTGAIISMSVVFQYVTTLTPQFKSLRLLHIMAIVYVLLALLSVGYVLVALGAKKLQKIEEV